jgi:hypothetical protein
MRAIDTRRTIHANISAEAREGWRSFCDENGVSISAMVEAVGLYYARVARGEIAPSRRGQAAVAEARRIDVERRSRSNVKSPPPVEP